MTRKKEILWATAALILGGCRAQTLQQDQTQMRTSLLSMYQEQVISNALHCAAHEPIIEIDFKTITGTVTSASKGTASMGRQSAITYPVDGLIQNGSGTLGVAGTHTITVNPTVGAEQDQTTQLTITGDPVLDDDVYKAYEQFSLPPDELGQIQLTSAPLVPGAQSPDTTAAIGVMKAVAATQPNDANLANAVKDAEEAAKIARALAQPPADEFPAAQPPKFISDSKAVYIVSLTKDDLHKPPQPVQLHCGVTRVWKIDPVTKISHKKPNEKTFGGIYETDFAWYYIPADPETMKEFYKLYRQVVLKARKTGPGNSTDAVKQKLDAVQLNQLLAQ